MHFLIKLSPSAVYGLMWNYKCKTENEVLTQRNTAQPSTPASEELQHNGIFS